MQGSNAGPNQPAASEATNAATTENALRTTNSRRRRGRRTEATNGATTEIQEHPTQEFVAPTAPATTTRGRNSRRGRGRRKEAATAENGPRPCSSSPLTPRTKRSISRA